MQSGCSKVRFCDKSCVKRSFWKLGFSFFGESFVQNDPFGSLVENGRLGSFNCHFLVKVSWKMLVLEAWIVTFGGKCKVSWKTLVLEAWIVTFGESLVEHARFGSLDCHFW